MRDSIHIAILSDQFKSSLFDNHYNITQIVVTILLAMIISEALALVLYRIISSYTEQHFYSTFPSYSIFMFDLIDSNEHPFMPLGEQLHGGAGRGSHHISLDERRLLIDKILTTKRLDERSVKLRNINERDEIENRVQKDPLCHKSSSVSSLQSLEGTSTSSDVCPICLVELKVNDSVSHSRSCNHEYHTDCIHQWLEKNDTCPCCRRNVFI
mmetsp:Transcript_21870/g.32736  ORF Transcript_21870/g.32736 Transcript_21870/m.32736 type:complete len:212 (+) Transcript_21870:169-804(+)